MPDSAPRSPPKKGFVFAAVLAAGLSIASYPVSPIPENPYSAFPVARIPPSPYTLCEPKDGICAPRIFITHKKQLREAGALSKAQLNTIRQLETMEITQKLKWLYEGTPVEKAISEFPPIAFELELKPGEDAALSSGWGAQLQNSNLALLDFGRSSGSSAQEIILAHELIHYISWLGSGWEASYLFEGEKISTIAPLWIAEGMANWAACRTPGFSCLLNNEGTGLKNYHEETYVAVFLEALIGKEALRNALVSGDFVQIQSSLDTALGKETFERIMDKESVSDVLRLLAVRTKCFKEPAVSTQSDPFTKDAFAFLQNVSQILMSEFCGWN